MKKNIKYDATFSPFYVYVLYKVFCMDKKFLIFLLAFYGIVLNACNKPSETEEKWANEEAELALWIKENDPDAIFDNDVYIRKFGIASLDSIKPDPLGYVLVNYESRLLYDDLVERVSDKDYMGYNAMNPSLYKEGGPEMWSPTMWGNKGVGKLYEKEQAYVYIPSRLLSLQDFQPRRFDIALVKVINNLEKYQNEDLMGNYMKRFCNELDTITATINGRDYYLIYHVAKEGDGSEIGSSSFSTKTTEKYFMQIEDIKTCFNNKEIRWNDDKTRFSAKKFSEMFVNNEEKNNKALKRGGRIIAVMPYKMMFGDDPYRDGDQFIAPENSVLLYEIDIDK